MRFLLTLVCFILAQSVNAADTAKSVRVGVFAQNLPMVSYDAEAGAQGIFPELLEAIAATEGWTLEYVPGTWSECLARLDTGEIDIQTSIAYTTERAQRFAFSEETVLSNWGQIYASPDSDIQSILDLEGKTIAVMRNSVFTEGPEGLKRLAEKFKIKAHFLEVDDYAAAMQAATEGKAQAALANRLFLKRHEDEYLLKATPILISPIEIRFAFPLHAEASIRKAIDSNLRQMKDEPDSDYHRIIQHWMGHTLPEASPAWWLPALIFSAILTAALGLLFVTSRLQVRRKSRDLDTVLKSVGDGLVVCDTEGRVLLMNPAAAALATDKLSAPRTQKAGEIFGEPSLDAQIEAVNKGTEAVAIEWSQHRSETSDNRVIEARTSPISASGERTSGTVTVLRDITRTRDLDRMKNEFISTAAHELRTPLAAISLCSEMLENPEEFGLSDPDQQRELLASIGEKTERLEVLISDLLDLSRIQAGQAISLQLVPVAIADLMSEIGRQCNRGLNAERIELHLPNAEAKVVADPNKIAQVLENLIGNALKFSETGSRIRLTGLQQGKDFLISVADEGIGMTTEQMTRVFDKFYRADTSLTARAGLGLGMSIAKSIIEAHGGRIWLESERGRGTTSYFTLPLSSD